MEEAVERNKFPLQGLPGFAHVWAFLVAREGGSKQSGSALSGTIDDVQMVLVVGGDQISWRKEHRWEAERCEEGGEEDAVKSLFSWRPNDMQWGRREGERGEGGGGEGGGVLMRDVVLFFSRGSAEKNCLRSEEVLCDVLRRGDGRVKHK